MRSFALVVGINQYPTRTGQDPLHGAAADAEAFAEWVLHPDGGRVALEDLHFWSHPWPVAPGPLLAAHLAGQLPLWYSPTGQAAALADPTRAPYAEEIVRTAEELGDRVQAEILAGIEAGPTRIFVFFAGHGIRVPLFGADPRQTCFVCGDMRPSGDNYVLGVIPCDAFRDSLGNRRFDQVFLFLDCCRTDPPTLTRKAQPISDLTGSAQLAPWAIGHAALEGQQAYEVQTAVPVRGAFSKTLIEGLHGCRGPGDDLDAERLDKFVRTRISQHTAMPQSPYVDFQPRVPAPRIAWGAATIPLPGLAGPRVRLDNLEADRTVEVVANDGTVVWSLAPPFAAGAVPVITLPEPGYYALRVVGEPHRETLFRFPGTEDIDVKVA